MHVHVGETKACAKHVWQQTRLTVKKKKKTTRLRIGKKPTYTILCHNLFFLMKITGFFCYLNGI